VDNLHHALKAADGEMVTARVKVPVKMVTSENVAGLMS
jgi:hypothetical protein